MKIYILVHCDKRGGSVVQGASSDLAKIKEWYKRDSEELGLDRPEFFYREIFEIEIEKEYLNCIESIPYFEVKGWNS